MTAFTVPLCLGLAVLCSAAIAPAEGKYQVTDAERAACEGDAISLCSAAYPDEDAMLACMKVNLTKLTTGCRPVFMEGLRRRGLN